MVRIFQTIQHLPNMSQFLTLVIVGQTCHILSNESFFVRLNIFVTCGNIITVVDSSSDNIMVIEEAGREALDNSDTGLATIDQVEYCPL